MKDGLTIHKPGTHVTVGLGKDKIEAKILAARIGNKGSVYYEIAFWKDRVRVTEQVAEFEIQVGSGGDKNKIPIGFHE